MGRFKKINTEIDDLFVIECEPYFDDRGYFYENYNENDFKDLGINKHFVQDNHSKSIKGVLRGLHFQINHPQAKLVRCIKGEVYDVAIDLRINSKTYGKHFGITLTEDNFKMFYIPEGFAHGFLVMSETAEFNYKVSDFYHPGDEGGIIYNDLDLNIKWPINNFNIILSDKDKNNQSFKTYTDKIKNG